MDNAKILDTIKPTIGIAPSDTSFDIDIIMYVNATLSILFQLGVDEAGALPIIDETTTWYQLIGNRTDLELVKSYIRFKVKLMFDPPTSSAALDAMNRSIGELEWRITNLKTIKNPLVGEVINNG
ncbi:hypothetical protein SDC9_59469 [bioreactor metagenome]|uniref:Uncharacterized protein n=1 Tax=bioreactor metagenome TaxID=1076179 RepID=A0A644XG67_9ZZZZ